MSLEDEIFRPIEEFPRYKISSFGRVLSPYGRILIPSCIGSKKGYQVIALGANKQKYIHRLVAENFLKDSWLPGLEVAHLDGNSKNNNLSNLKWVSCAENSSHRLLHGTDARGSKSVNSKLTEKDVLNILNSRLPLATIAKKYGICYQHVSRIRRGERWGHIS